MEACTRLGHVFASFLKHSTATASTFVWNKIYDNETLRSLARNRHYLHFLVVFLAILKLFDKLQSRVMNPYPSRLPGRRDHVSSPKLPFACLRSPSNLHQPPPDHKSLKQRIAIRTSSHGIWRHSEINMAQPSADAVTQFCEFSGLGPGGEQVAIVFLKVIAYVMTCILWISMVQREDNMGSLTLGHAEPTTGHLGALSLVLTHLIQGNNNNFEQAVVNYFDNPDPSRYEVSHSFNPKPSSVPYPQSRCLTGRC